MSSAHGPGSCVALPAANREANKSLACPIKVSSLDREIICMRHNAQRRTVSHSEQGTAGSSTPPLRSNVIIMLGRFGPLNYALWHIVVGPSAVSLHWKHVTGMEMRGQ